jgi:hypothetical protein
MSKICCQTPSVASKERWVAEQSGCQSPEHPTSDWKLPGMVTNAGCGGAAAAETVRTLVVEFHEKTVSTQSEATVKGMLGPFATPPSP